MRELQFILIVSNIIIINGRLYRHSMDVFGKHNIFIEAHRGVNREIFQNTKEAFQRAIDYDIDAIETDVWITKDNVAVLVHAGSSGDLGGYYDKTGKVTELTWEELKTYRTVEDNLLMPRLDETMEQTKNKIFMNLEIKDGRIDIVFPIIIGLIEKYDYIDQICLSSFHHDYIKKIEEYNKNHDKKIVFGFSYSKGKSSEFDYSKKGHFLQIFYTDATKKICDKAHENGMAIQAWFKMTTEENTYIYKQLIENGVDVIMSNVPLLAKIYRNHYYE